MKTPTILCERASAPHAHVFPPGSAYGSGDPGQVEAMAETKLQVVETPDVSELASPAGRQSRTRRSNWAFAATMIVLTDMSTAPVAGLSTIPRGSSTPAANGIATML
jgi:hypothetical protein